MIEIQNQKLEKCKWKETDNVAQLHILSTGLAKSPIMMIRNVLFRQCKKLRHILLYFQSIYFSVDCDDHMEIHTLDLLHVRLIMKIYKVYRIFSPTRFIWL